MSYVLLTLDLGNFFLKTVVTGKVGGNNTVESLWSYSGPTGINVIFAGLVANVAYPVSIFYASRGSLGAMNLTYTDPSSKIYSDFSGFVYHFKKKINNCEYDYEDLSPSIDRNINIYFH